MIAKHPIMPTAALPVSRAEGIWLVVAMLAGAVLRLGNLHQVAVEHFDEAVYASNLMFRPEEGGEYPYRQLYAPPLLPSAIEWTTIFGQMFLGNVPSWWPMLPTLIAGLATIPSLWWIARQWFSPRAGIVAAMLLAMHGYHAAYCRTALTDVPLALFVLWAVHGFWIALQTARTRDAVIAGVFTSLAWWTKYNGWLPLAIVGSGGVLWQLVTPRAERDWSKLVRVWLIGAATAFVLWIPVLWDCQKVGGYAAVAENHRRYVDGFEKWLPNLWRAIANFDEFTGPLMSTAMLFVLVGSWWIPRNVAQWKIPLSSRSQLANFLISAWWIGLLVVTPCYFPYSRLWMPWVLSVLFLAVTPVWLPNIPELTPRIHRIAQCVSIFSALLALVGFRVMGSDVSRSPAGWENRAGALRVSREIRGRIAAPDAPVFVLSEPAIWFHLRQQGQPAVIASGLEFLQRPAPAPAYLVVGSQAERDPQFEHEWQAAESRWELAGEFSFPPSRIVLLDQFSPRDLAEHPERRTLTVKLYRVRK